jgi:hypothetical protein
LDLRCLLWAKPRTNNKSAHHQEAGTDFAAQERWLGDVGYAVITDQSAVQQLRPIDHFVAPLSRVGGIANPRSLTSSCSVSNFKWPDAGAPDGQT